VTVDQRNDQRQQCIQAGGQVNVHIDHAVGTVPYQELDVLGRRRAAEQQQQVQQPQKDQVADATTRATIMPRRLATPTSLVSGGGRLLEPLTRVFTPATVLITLKGQET
jgi:hypothetical protein